MFQKEFEEINRAVESYKNAMKNKDGRKDIIEYKRNLYRVKVKIFKHINSTLNDMNKKGMESLIKHENDIPGTRFPMKYRIPLHENDFRIGSIVKINMCPQRHHNCIIYDILIHSDIKIGSVRPKGLATEYKIKCLNRSIDSISLSHLRPMCPIERKEYVLKHSSALNSFAKIVKNHIEARPGGKVYMECKERFEQLNYQINCIGD